MISKLTKLTLAGAIATGLALAQTPTQTQTSPAPAAKAKAGRGMARHRMMKALALTPAQKQQAKQIFAQAKTANQPVRTQLQQNRQSLSAAIKANDVNQIHQLTQSQANLRAQMAESHAGAMAKFYQSLTPDQKAKADQMQQNLQKRMAARRGNG